MITAGDSLEIPEIKIKNPEVYLAPGSSLELRIITTGVFAKLTSKRETLLTRKI